MNALLGSSSRRCLLVLPAFIFALACTPSESDGDGGSENNETCLTSGCNGDELSDTDAAGSDEGEGQAAIIGAGWSFGECVGPCVGTLTIGDDDLLVLTIADWEGQAATENQGTLSAEGRAQLDAAAADLLGESLEEVYGCPDCDDGGASRITLVRDGEESEHGYEFGAPPPVLTTADGLINELNSALSTCTEGALLTIDEGCEPSMP